jgi:2-polyprenyl-3-methyl-5-hydroxy-6-metoxy-1,4-benzoquinol methylase
MPRSVTTGPADEARESMPVERLDPDRLAGELVEAEHLLRYHWAAGAVSGLEVLDAGCGTGYGCALMAAAGAKRCVGVDIAEVAIEHARAHQQPDGDTRVQFIVADVTSLPFEDASFDAVTCFETIEHLDDQRALVAECARVLRPGGLLLVSSPNRDEYPPGNPYHVRELTPAELESLLAERFSHVALMRQHNWLLTAVLDDEGFSSSDADDPLDAQVRKLQGLEPGHELYTLAVASDSPVESVRQQALVTHGLEVRRWLETIESQNAELDRRANELMRLGDELNVTRTTLAATEQQLLEVRDRRSIAMAQLERKAYWLERAEINPDAWMRRRPARLAFRALRLLLRARRKLIRRG